MQQRSVTLAAYWLFAAFSISACSERDPVSKDLARDVADRRFSAHAKALGIEVDPIPEPQFEDRGTNYHFVFTRGRAVVTVIVERTGEVADGVEFKDRGS